MLRVPQSGITWHADITTNPDGNEAGVTNPYFDPILVTLPDRTFVDRTCEPFPSVEFFLLALYKMTRMAMHRLRNWHGLGWHKLSKLSLTMGSYYWDVGPPCSVTNVDDGRDVVVPIPERFRRQGLQGLTILFNEDHDRDFFWEQPRPFNGPAARIMLKLEDSESPCMVFFEDNALYPPPRRGGVPDQTPVAKVREWLLKLITHPSECTWLFHSWILEEGVCPDGLEALCSRVVDRTRTEIHFCTEVQTWATHIPHD
jgi:hypothetical protein